MEKHVGELTSGIACNLRLQGNENEGHVQAAGVVRKERVYSNVQLVINQLKPMLLLPVLRFGGHRFRPPPPPPVGILI